MSIHKIFSLPFCALLLGAMPAGEVNAQAPAAAPQPRNVYAAKFVCGRIAGDDDVVRGVYATSINIHNPQSTEVKFDKRVVIANREGLQPGQPSPPKTDVLGPGQALRVDCRVIAGFLPSPVPSHIEGFVEIAVPSSDGTLRTLDVVGKYTARPSNGEVSGLEVVVYTPAQIR